MGHREESRQDCPVGNFPLQFGFAFGTEGVVQLCQHRQNRVPTNGKHSLASNAEYG
jgi:hypothetical protein